MASEVTSVAIPVGVPRLGAWWDPPHCPVQEGRTLFPLGKRDGAGLSPFMPTTGLALQSAGAAKEGGLPLLSKHNGLLPCNLN